MEARDRYTSRIKCPKCTEEGVLHISENDYPFMKKLRRDVDKVEGNFIATMHGEFEIKITCKTCGEGFFWGTRK